MLENPLIRFIITLVLLYLIAGTFFFCVSLLGLSRDKEDMKSLQYASVKEKIILFLLMYALLVSMWPKALYDIYGKKEE